MIPEISASKIDEAAIFNILSINGKIFLVKTRLDTSGDLNVGIMKLKFTK